MNAVSLASRRLGRLLHPVGTRVKLLAAIDPFGYFDEGGTHAQSRIVVIGGYVKPAVDWEPIEVEFKQILLEEGAPFYHTTDIEAYPPRGIYKDWTKEKAERLTDRIVPIAARIADQ